MTAFLVDELDELVASFHLGSALSAELLGGDSDVVLEEAPNDCPRILGGVLLVHEALLAIAIQRKPREGDVHVLELLRASWREASSKSGKSQIRPSLARGELPKRPPTIIEDTASVHLVSFERVLRDVGPEEALAFSWSEEASLVEDGLDAHDC